MPKEKKYVRIGYPILHAYQHYKKDNDVYLCFHDEDSDTEYTLIIDGYHLLQWIGSKEIAQIKQNTIKMVEKL